MSTALSEDKQLEMIDWGVVDFDDQTLIVKPHQLKMMEEKIKTEGYEIARVEKVKRALNPVMIEDEAVLEKVLDLASELENNEDVVTVYSGMDYAEKT